MPLATRVTGSLLNDTHRCKEQQFHQRGRMNIIEDLEYVHVILKIRLNCLNLATPKGRTAGLLTSLPIEKS